MDKLEHNFSVFNSKVEQLQIDISLANKSNSSLAIVEKKLYVCLKLIDDFISPTLEKETKHNITIIYATYLHLT